MIIGSCGYIGTGSSIVTDLLKEYDDIEVFDKIEFSIAFLPDGLEDLEYQLNEHCVKYTSSVVAMERFLRAAYYYMTKNKFGFDKNKRILDATNEFLDNISQVTWNGRGMTDLTLYGDNKFHKIKGFSMPFQSMMVMLKNKGLIYKNKDDLNVLHKYRFASGVENFAECANDLIKKYLEIYGVDTNKNIVLDQPFSNGDPFRSMKYYGDDCKAILVDRDPRDKFIASKISRRRTASGFHTPVDNVQDYITYYRKVREKSKSIDSDRVIRINMESFIYEYEESKKLIEEYCNVHNHINPQKYFKPQKSIANTQLIKKFPEFKKEIEIIEDQLSDYLFPFEKYKDVKSDGKVFF